jgi:cold shock CspA family protein
MRTHGNLIKWDDERGFGFIAPLQGGEEIFVHVSAFKPGTARPRLHERVSFEVQTKANGKKAAVRVQRAGETGVSHRSRRNAPGVSARKSLSGILILIAIVAIGALVYKRNTSDIAALARPSTLRSSAAATPAASGFSCDGRTMCSQMRSCEEAVYFLQNCPNVQMDGNGDGEPCEQQWCTR